MALDPASRLEKLIAKQSPLFAAGFRLLVKQMKSDMDLDAIADLLARGRLEDALTETLRRAPNMGNLYLNSFVAAAEDTAGFLNKSLQQIVVDFDTTNPFSMRVMREERLRMIREFTAQQRLATREAIIDGIERGLNPIQQARNFRDSIGLTVKQQRAVNNYRRMLSEGDRAVLDRALRDKRFDSTIRNAFDSGQPLTRTQMNRMVDRYRERFVKYRSEVIARTESLRAVHAGKQSMYEQAIESGDLQQDNLTQEWNTARDEAVRGSHSAMHGQKIPFGQRFISGLGNMALHPGAFNVAAEDIQCRCTLGTRITEVTVPSGLEITIL